MSASWHRDEALRRLSAGLAELGIEAGLQAGAQLLDLCELLARWAAGISLSAYRDPGAILDHLVLDALALSRELPEAPSVADLGSGAGFPGLPLAILFPERRFTLVESRVRKHHFQREALRRLGLENVRALLGRSDELVPEPHGLALAQALAKPEAALALLRPWCEARGWLAIPGGASAAALERIGGDPSLQTEIRRYRVPGTGQQRTLWIGRRVAASP